jgi:hypothetical protein
LIDKRNISFTKFLKGALLGPLAILPASFILHVAVSLPFASLTQFLHRINSLFAIAFWGIVVAYALTFSYGTLLWLLLLKIKKHNLIWFLTGSLLPSLLLFIYSKSVGFAILFGYYSLAVSFSCWYLAIWKEFKS